MGNFRKNVYPKNKDLFGSLATGQSPEILFITCSDSRVDPNLVTGSAPGDLFICRNAGNIVPPHSNETGGMTASIEYAVAVLGVRHIIICGHTDCGAVTGALDVDNINGLPHVKEWLGHCREAIEENVLQQVQHIRTHPAVAARLATGKVHLHGWIYDIKTGSIRCCDHNQSSFNDFDVQYAEEIKGLE